jgi:hypothetical protein
MKISAKSELLHKWIFYHLFNISRSTLIGTDENENVIRNDKKCYDSVEKGKVLKEYDTITVYGSTPISATDAQTWGRTYIL